MVVPRARTACCGKVIVCHSEAGRELDRCSLTRPHLSCFVWPTQLLGAPFNRALLAIEWGLQNAGIAEDSPRSGNQAGNQGTGRSPILSATSGCGGLLSQHVMTILSTPARSSLCVTRRAYLLDTKIPDTKSFVRNIVPISSLKPRFWWSLGRTPYYMRGTRRKFCHTVDKHA
jgi:hypothetical protein